MYLNALNVISEVPSAEVTNSAIRGICVSETVSRAHVVDSFLSLLLRVTILFWRYVVIKSLFLLDNCQTLNPFQIFETL